MMKRQKTFNSFMFIGFVLVVTVITTSCTKKCYRCKQTNVVCYVCKSPNDTLILLDYGLNKILQEELNWYQTHGYSCVDSAVPTEPLQVFPPNNQDCLSEDDYLTWKWQGYDCYQSQ